MSINLINLTLRLDITILYVIDEIVILIAIVMK